MPTRVVFNIFVDMASRNSISTTARLAQSVERKALNLVVVGSSPTVGAFCKYLVGFLHDTLSIAIQS